MSCELELAELIVEGQYSFTYANDYVFIERRIRVHLPNIHI
jgi:hypothetical protein